MIFWVIVCTKMLYQMWDDMCSIIKYCHCHMSLRFWKFSADFQSILLLHHWFQRWAASFWWQHIRIDLLSKKHKDTMFSFHLISFSIFLSRINSDLFLTLIKWLWLPLDIIGQFFQKTNIHVNTVKQVHGKFPCVIMQQSQLFPMKYNIW